MFNEDPLHQLSSANKRRDTVYGHKTWGIHAMLNTPYQTLFITLCVYGPIRIEVAMYRSYSCHIMMIIIFILQLRYEDSL